MVSVDEGVVGKDVSSETVWEAEVGVERFGEDFDVEGEPNFTNKACCCEKASLLTYRTRFADCRGLFGADPVLHAM